MYHFTYMTISQSGKYYVGRHSTDNIDDGYKGSGKWIRNIKDTSTLETKILDFYESFEELKSAEEKLITEHINNPLNMNFNNSSVGFSAGDLNPAKSEEQRKRVSERLKLNNPMANGHTEESKRKISGALSGENNPIFGGHTEETKQKMSDSAKKRANTEEGRRQLSENGKKSKGKPTWNKGTKGQFSIGEEGKRKISESWKNREKLICEHCGKECAPNTFKRWHGERCKLAQSDKRNLRILKW